MVRTTIAARRPSTSPWEREKGFADADGVDGQGRVVGHEGFAATAEFASRRERKSR
jgi:hypothetical protein